MVEEEEEEDDDDNDDDDVCLWCDGNSDVMAMPAVEDESIDNNTKTTWVSSLNITMDNIVFYLLTHFRVTSQIH